MAQHGMLHEPLWRQWLSTVTGLVPIETLQNSRACTQGGFQTDLVRHMCGSGTGPLQQQHLFSVYVHTPGGQKGLLTVCAGGGGGEGLVYVVLHGFVPFTS